jgi:hypothetical protein
MTTNPHSPSCVLLFTEAEWPALTKKVAGQMSRFVEKYTTPISLAVSNDEGQLCGSGSYCNFFGKNFLVTNEHVARKRQDYSLAPKFFGDDSFFRLRNPFVALGAPIDIALARVDDDEWNRFPHKASAICSTQFAESHELVEGELLFIAGYSGDRCRFSFGCLFTHGTPYLARECPLPENTECDSKFHFALDYNPEKATSIDGTSRGLPLPPGLSGTLVWNTRVVEMKMRGKPWTPQAARVTGIVWGWPATTCLLATKIEHMRMGELATGAIAVK